MTADFGVAREGSIFLLKPQTAFAREWSERHIPADAPRFGGSIAIEHRYIHDIACGILDYGLTVEDMKGGV